MIDFSVDFTVPAEMFVGGGVHERAPTVIDIYVEFIVANLVEIGIRDAEVVVQTVAVGCEGVGQEDFPFARLDGIRSRDLTGALRCGDGVCTFVKDGDDGRGLASAPQIVFQFALHLQGEAAVVAEVVRQRDNPNCGVQEGQVQCVDLRTTVGIRMCEGVGSGFRVCLPVPEIVFASIVAFGGVGRRVDREIEGDDAVAAFDGLEMKM